LRDLQIGVGKRYLNDIIRMLEQRCGFLRSQLEAEHAHIFIFQNDGVMWLVGRIERDGIAVRSGLVLRPAGNNQCESNEQ
jgi:hypothetical protein